MNWLLRYSTGCLRNRRGLTARRFGESEAIDTLTFALFLSEFVSEKGWYEIENPVRFEILVATLTIAIP